MPLELKHMTPAILRRVVKDSHEEAEPWETIAAVMEENAGKPLNIRHAREIAKRLPNTWHNDDQDAPQGRGRVWLLHDTGWHTAEITHQAAGAPWDDRRSCTVWRENIFPNGENLKVCPTREQLEKLNPAHYAAREKRNVRRSALLNGDGSELRHLAREMNKARKALEEVGALFVFGEPCEVEQYGFSAAWGWDNRKGAFL